MPQVHPQVDEGWERFSTMDLLVLTSFDRLLFILKILFTFFTKQVTLLRRSTVLILFLQLVFPGEGVMTGQSTLTP